jgi:hypothetical protein
MILRAVFWIGLVSLLMPREPDLGLGRPGAQVSPVTQALTWATGSLAKPDQACQSHEATCAAALGILDSFQGVAVRSLAQVKADIEKQQRERNIRG